MNIYDNFTKVAKEIDKETVSIILGHIEKYCIEVDEVEELLWKLLDKIEEDEYKEQYKDYI